MEYFHLHQVFQGYKYHTEHEFITPPPHSRNKKSPASYRYCDYTEDIAKNDPIFLSDFLF